MDRFKILSLPISVHPRLSGP